MKSGGFSVLEAIVAVAMMATVGMAVFAWIHQCLDTLYRIRQDEERSEAIQNAIDFMAGVNPMETPAGESSLGPYSIRWTSCLVEPIRPGIRGQSARGLYRIGLYDASIEIVTEKQKVADFVLRQAGYRRVRNYRIQF